MTEFQYLQPYIPVVMILVIALGFAVLSLTFASMIGPKRPNKSKALAYECGIVPTGEANVRLPIKFYLVALLFLLFDMETILIMLWAIAFRSEGGAYFQFYAFGVMVFFMAILIVGFIYEWKKGALEWT